ncbi:MAG: group 1 glycosyl transferase [Frankiales bacterium]|nr:group 1 glycosyl transferase [Frankiales bacterium]
MKFAVYHPWVYLRGGAEKILAELLERSTHDWTVYTHHHDAAATFDQLRGPAVVELEPRVSVRRSLGPLAHAASTMARTRLPHHGAQGLLVSSEGLGDLVLARTDLPAVAYCHTPLKILHDPATRAALRERDPRKAAALKVLGGPFQQVDRALWKRYRHVLVNSQEVRGRVLRGGLAAAERVEVLRPGVHVERFALTEAQLAELDMSRPEQPMFLVAGRIMWQKNIELAIDALALVRQQGADARLVIAGAVDEKSQPYLAALRARCGDLPVEFEVNPSNARLTRLFQSAAALLFTPPNEDWGIVPLEAMAAGTPVIAVNAGGPCESVQHGHTGWLLPNDAQAFAWQMHAVAASAVGRPSELIRMGEACRERAAEFTWDHFVSRLDEVMVAVAEQGRATPVSSTPRVGAQAQTRPSQSIAARSSLPASAHVLAVG